jgi:pimeloyl-ACP methyl ester carboxylesterase
MPRAAPSCSATASAAWSPSSSPARHPSLPSAVVALDPGPIDTLPETQASYDTVVASMSGPDGEAVRREFVEGNFLPTADPEVKRHVVERMTSVPLPLATLMLRKALEWNGVGALRRCPVPVLVLLSATGGSNDPPRVLAHRPSAHIGVTVGTGHFHQLEAPEQVTPMIERFLATLS